MSDRPILVEIPASSAYLSLARAATSSVCARLNYPVDRLEDLTLAVSEAIALLLQDAAAGARIRVELTPWSSHDLVGVDIDVSTRSSSGRPPRPNSFTWTVLASLVNNVSSEIEDSTVTLRLRSRQEPVIA